MIKKNVRIEHPMVAHGAIVVNTESCYCCCFFFFFFWHNHQHTSAGRLAVTMHFTVVHSIYPIQFIHSQSSAQDHTSVSRKVQPLNISDFTLSTDGVVVR